MSLKKQFMFVKKLESLYKSGRPISESMEMLAKNERSLSLRSAFLNISREIKSGSSLSAALDKNDYILDDVYIRLIHVGEISGRLDEVLGHILDLQNSLLKLRRKIIAASIYPLAVIGVFGFLVFILLFIVLPGIVSFMVKYGQCDPLPLLFLTNIQQSLFSPLGMLIFPITIVILALIIYVYLNIESLSRFRGILLFFTPGFGRIDKFKNMYAYLFTMKIAYDSGLSVYESAELSAHNISNAYMYDIFIDVYHDIKNGNTVSDALRKTSLFDFDMIDLIRVGEETGKMEESYNQIIKILDDKINITIAVMVAMIKPLGILFGLAVLVCIFLGLGLILFKAYCMLNKALPH